MECKLLHCEYKAFRGVDYQSMPLQCIVFSGLICSQHAIEMDLVSQKAPTNPDSNDSSPISVSLKTKKLFKFFIHRTQLEQTIVWWVLAESGALEGSFLTLTVFTASFFADTRNQLIASL